MLRTCAFHLYDWACDHPDVLPQGQDIRSGRIPEGYPELWPTPGRKVLPPNTVAFNETIRARTTPLECPAPRGSAPACAHL